MSPSRDEMDPDNVSNREGLEVKKLRLEVNELARPDWFRSSFWFNLIGGLMAIGGMWLQMSAAKSDTAAANMEKAGAINEKSVAINERSVAQQNERVATHERSVAQKNEQEALVDLNAADVVLGDARKTLEDHATGRASILSQLETLVRTKREMSVEQVANLKAALESSAKPIHELKLRIDKLPEKRVSRVIRKPLD